jgi:hypothetical protein
MRVITEERNIEMYYKLRTSKKCKVIPVTGCGDP